MVKPVQKAEISSFVKGLVTDASPLNFPGDASIDEQNFNLNIDGTRDRRFGLDFETNYQLRSTGYTEADLIRKAASSYKWYGAGNNASNEFIVVQFGTYIFVFDASKASISRDGFIGSVTLTGVDAEKRFSYAAIDGNLVIAASTDVIHFVKYTGSSLVYTTNRLLVRDLWGLPGFDNNDLNKRPTALTDSILYNLRNQGWGVPRKDSTGTLTDPITVFNNYYSKYPSNYEVVYTGLQFQSVSSGTPFERIYPNMYEEVLGLDLPAAKGYFIIDALRRGTSRKSAFDANQTKFTALSYSISSLPADVTSGGASVVADFSGRVFYGGFSGEVTDGDSNSPILSSYILFSQVSKSADDLVKCYSRGDPTSRENSDVVDTDGGFIRISGAKKIVGLIGLSGALFVLADNGVWLVEGGANYGFSATNYAVKRLSSFGCVNTNSITVANDQIFFWGEAGIYGVAKNQYGDWQVQSITEGKIQKLYDGISTTNKANAYGIYDLFDKKIRWLFNQDLDRNDGNTVSELILDLRLSAYSKNRIYNITSTQTPEVIGMVPSSSFVTGNSPTNIVVGGNPVTVGAGNNVTVSASIRDSGLQSVKYITLYGSISGKVGFTFSQYKDTTFREWLTVDGVGVDAYAYILTGWVTAGDSSIAKQSPYLVMHFRKTEEGVVTSGGELIPDKQSSCLVQSQWDWANSVISNKWSTKFQAYRMRRPVFIENSSDDFNTGFQVVTSKSKLRGRGKAMSMMMETESGKDCRILGWSLSLTGNSLA